MWHTCIPFEGLHKDVQGQLSHEEAPAHSRASSTCLRRMWQGLCGELKTKAASASSYWREALSGNYFRILSPTILHTILIDGQYVDFS